VNVDYARGFACEAMILQRGAAARASGKQRRTLLNAPATRGGNGALKTGPQCHQPPAHTHQLRMEHASLGCCWRGSERIAIRELAAFSKPRTDQSRQLSRNWISIRVQKVLNMRFWLRQGLRRWKWRDYGLGRSRSETRRGWKTGLIASMRVYELRIWIAGLPPLNTRRLRRYDLALQQSAGAGRMKLPAA